MITVKLNEESKERPFPKPFPKLMKNSSGDIVYFVRHDFGLPINGWGNGGWRPDDIEVDLWDMDCFTDYNKPITIQNA